MINETIGIGKFINTLKLDNVFNSQKNKNTFIVKNLFIYKDSYGNIWKANIGDEIDGSSIPDIAYKLFSNDIENKFKRAIILFEVACNKREQTWESTHKMFFEAMLTSGIDEISSKIMYACVYYFGQHWAGKLEKDKIYFNILKQAMFTLEDFYALKQDIEEKNISIQEIEAYDTNSLLSLG